MYIYLFFFSSIYICNASDQTITFVEYDEPFPNPPMKSSKSKVYLWHWMVARYLKLIVKYSLFVTDGIASACAV